MERRKTAAKILRKAAILVILMLPAAWFLGLLHRPLPRGGVALRPLATVRQPELDEASGLVQSATHPERFWLHNDSGDVARIFAVGLDGNVLRPPGPAYHGILVEKARNHDWEDIARNGDHLYLSDMGNNLNMRRDLGVYDVVEPDPETDRSVPATAFLPIRYPDQTAFPPTDSWDFDCEAIFSWNDHLYFISKTRPAFRLYVQGSWATLYRLDSMRTDRANVLTVVDRASGLGGWVTAADTSQDGTYLAVLVQSPLQSVWLYQRPARGDRFFSEASSVRRFIFHDAGQIESLAFHRRADASQDIVMLNEEREIFEIPLTAFQPATPGHGLGPAKEMPSHAQTPSR
jgi:hypothetical protein